MRGIASSVRWPNCVGVKKDDFADRSEQAEGWTRIEDYLGALLQRSRRRRRRRETPRTEPQDPRLWLSTLPFLLLLGALLMLVVAIAWLAWPGREHRRPPAPSEREIGTAPAGWIERAKKESANNSK